MQVATKDLGEYLHRYCPSPFILKKDSTLQSLEVPALKFRPDETVRAWFSDSSNVGVTRSLICGRSKSGRVINLRITWNAMGFKIGVAIESGMSMVERPAGFPTCEWRL